MDYRVLVLDLDGTTLNGAGELEERDIAAAQALQRAGVHVTIATGRLFTGSQWVAHRLGVRGSIAVMNGSELIDAETETVVHGSYVEPTHRVQARQVWASVGIQSGILFGSRRIHLDRRDEHRAHYLESWTRQFKIHEDVFASKEWSEAEDIVAVATMGEAGAVEHAQKELRQGLPDDIGTVTFPTSTGEVLLNLRHQGENKGTALTRLAEERGCTAAECVAVGDWLNDLPMLRTAGLSFAMRGSADDVATTAHEMLDTDRQSGGAVEEVAWRVWGVRA